MATNLQQFTSSLFMLSMIHRESWDTDFWNARIAGNLVIVLNLNMGGNSDLLMRIVFYLLCPFIPVVPVFCSEKNSKINNRGEGDRISIVRVRTNSENK